MCDLHFCKTEKNLKFIKFVSWEELRTETGKITQLCESFGTVNEDIIFYPEQKDLIKWNAKVGDEVKYVLIDGEYDIGKTRYEMRCESIWQLENDDAKNVQNWFDEVQIAEEQESFENDIDTDTEVQDDSNMQFEGYQKKEPNQEFYDLPCGLFEVLVSKNARHMKKKLDELVPSTLNYKTYKRRFHALIHLEEVEMKISFNKYKSRQVWIEPERRNRFSIMCSKIKELRPSIAIGDKIEVRNSKNPRRFYRGVVERVRDDRFILKFKMDFERDYLLGGNYLFMSFFFVDK